MLKKILYILITTVIFSGCINQDKKVDQLNTILQKDKIIVGTSFDSKPFSFKDNDGKIKGVEPDLAREISKRILGSSTKVEFKHVAPRERIKAVSTGNVDMIISAMTITPKRKNYVLFSKPYFIAGQAICVKKNSNIDSYHDLNNKNIVVVLGTTGESNIRNLAPNALIQGYVNNSDAFSAFKNPNNDAISTDDSILYRLIMENHNYKLLPQRLSREPYGIAFKKSREAKTFKKKVNKILNEMQLDGTLENIKDRWNIS